ncbi:BrnA antitoxin family protein [Actimicrobium sp. CCI2.3]|uniref:BrnA antitoxin family protein n=1 Tax=Actimicrobium sp. CCI2.3 TaxID=3048616 RepID=UPI002AB4FD43|nr:BrnA antitoxin family protein [Actimicrobium sp. CCI2.3]MDY7574456.1 BrnA antitoxin family protein [Actimicrobium sp. CCI2.3]MEB0022466.1 BrnA antitoxin family protein [Actimicrobium sp. CCI2.3]
MKKPSIKSTVTDDTKPYPTNDVQAAEDFWKDGMIHSGVAELRRLRGQRGTQKAPVKEAVSIRYDQAILTRFRESGDGWQTRMNAALKDWLKTHSPTDVAP